MPDETFNPESHYNSKIKDGTVLEQGTVLDFKRELRTNEKKKEKGKKRVIREEYKYEAFKQIADEHSKYIDRLIGNTDPNTAMAALYRADLTGARVSVDGQDGIIAEERKKTIIMLYSDNKVKCIPKKGAILTYKHKTVEYYFIGKNLKKSRFTKGH